MNNSVGGAADYVACELQRRQKLVNVAAGRVKADIALKNAAYVNVFGDELCRGDIALSDGRIAGIGEYEGVEEIDMSGMFVAPGLIDAHIHLESTMVTPSEFARAAVRRGATTVVADPHEIANVLGVDGIRYMLEATEGLPLDVFFMLPSCVPATDMDENGARLDYLTIDALYGNPRVLGLAEMMNYAAVSDADCGALSQTLACQYHNKLIDGHAPGLAGGALNAYIAAGAYSDHECEDIDDALKKLRLGQYIMIREGTAAKNLRALAPLLNGTFASRCMFATDDKHADDLLSRGHIDIIAANAVALGVNPLVALRAASHNAAQYFRLGDRGAIAPGYIADIVVFGDLYSFPVKMVFKRGKRVYDGRDVRAAAPEISPELMRAARDTFHVPPVTAKSFACGRLALMGVTPRQLLTKNLGFAQGVDARADILKLALVERHKNTGHIGLGYIKGFGLKSGALASSISHDSHNIICAGASDADMALAVNRVIALNGGVCLAQSGRIISQAQLSIAGLMSEEPLDIVNAKLERAKSEAYALGVQPGVDPFMTLSFLALPVIPHIRLTTRGMYDVDARRYI